MNEVATQKYLIATSVENALELAKENKSDFRYIAGGTDLMANRFTANETSNCLIDLCKLKDLTNVTEDGENLRIGSMITLHNLQAVDAIKNQFPALAEAAHSVGSPLIRQTATLGGNILF